MKITNLSDVKVGDIATYYWEDDTVPSTGPVRAPGRTARALFVGNTVIRHNDGSEANRIMFVSAERPTPQVPTEPNTFLLDVTDKRGNTYRYGRVGYEGLVMGFEVDGSHEYLRPGDIVSFTLATVVPA